MLPRPLLPVLLLLSTGIACTRAPDATVAHIASSAHPVVESLFARAPSPPDLNVGATSTLVQQIQAGAPASLLVSADPVWTQVLVDAGRARAVVPLATNGLVLAGLEPPGTLDALFDVRCVVVGDPSHVPLGRYTRTALEASGHWSAIEARLRPTLDAAAATAAVMTGACPLGVLYATDAARVGLHAIPLPRVGQPPIRLEAVVLDARGALLVPWLHDEDAALVWGAHGFGAP